EEVSLLYRQFLPCAPHWDDFGNALDGHYSTLALLSALQSCDAQSSDRFVQDYSEPVQFGFARFLPPGFFDKATSVTCWDMSTANDLRALSTLEHSVVNWEVELESANEDSR